MKKGEKAAPYIVRARVRRDLENLIAKARIETTPILRTPENDYQWRIVVNEGGLAHIFGALMDTISYSNFKDAVKHTPNQAHKVGPYMTIWGAMARVQPGGPYGRDFYREPHRPVELPFSAPAPKPQPQTTWRYSRNDLQQHAVPCRATKTHVDVKGVKRGKALCGAEESDWTTPANSPALRCPTCELKRESFGAAAQHQAASNFR